MRQIAADNNALVESRFQDLNRRLLYEFSTIISLTRSGDVQPANDNTPDPPINPLQPAGLHVVGYGVFNFGRGLRLGIGDGVDELWNFHVHQDSSYQQL